MIEIMKCFHALAKLLTAGLDILIFRRFYDGYTGTPNLSTLPFWANGIATFLVFAMTIFFSYNQSGLEVCLVYYWLTISFVNVLLHIRQVFMMPTVLKKLIYFFYMLAFSLLIGFLAIRLFAILIVIMVIFILITVFCKAQVWSAAQSYVSKIPVCNTAPKYELSNGTVVHPSSGGWYRDDMGGKYAKRDDLFYKVE